MWISDAFGRGLLAFAALLCFSACGLAEDPRDEENKYVYLTFTDPAFEKYCLDHFDVNGDKRISRYEAQRVLDMDCSHLGIRSLNEISEFSHLRTLNCSSNLLTQLDLRRIIGLRTVDCSVNELVSLYVDKLRGLTSLSCGMNRLTQLNLQSNGSLSTLVCDGNDLSTLDLSACARTMQTVIADKNPRLTTLYYASGQLFRAMVVDSQTQLVER